jgi:hypothetical protein
LFQDGPLLEKITLFIMEIVLMLIVLQQVSGNQAKINFKTFHNITNTEGVKYARILKTYQNIEKVFNVFATHLQAWETNDGENDRKEQCVIHLFCFFVFFLVCVVVLLFLCFS